MEQAGGTMVPYAISAVFGSLLLLILMFADYLRKYNADAFQRCVFLAVLEFAFAAIVMDFLHLLFEGIPGMTIRTLLYTVNILYYFCQVASYYLICIFIDSITFSNRNRTKRLLIIAAVIQLVHVCMLLINTPTGFYFYLTADNVFTYGNLYGVRLAISYLPGAFVIIEIVSALRQFKKSQAGMILFFFVLTSLGSVLDILLKTVSLVWPCFSAALLYIYFFIIKTDSRIDSLTGIGNRYSFNEFIDKLSRSNIKQSYSIVMIDVDRFKEINDTLGHAEGDNALRDLAGILKNNIRSSDFAARYGGDEFVLAARAGMDINQIIQRIQGALDEQNNKNIRPYKIRISYGYGTFDTKSGQSVENFFAYIDGLMYKNKQERRRCTDVPAPEGTANPALG
jgi:diguanylate cyclase (GGDEF)-like protein